jgi:hypothetical protein
VYVSHLLQLKDDHEPEYIVAEKGTLCVLVRRLMTDLVCVWDLPTETFRIAFSIYEGGCEDWACGMTLHQGILYVGFKSGIIKVWSLEAGKCIGFFEGHQEEEGHDKGVGSLVVAGQWLRSICSGGRTKTWNLETKECIAKADTEEKVLAVEGESLYAGFKDGTISALNLRTGKASSFNGYEADPGRPDVYGFEKIGESRVRTLVSTGGILYGHSTYAGISIWDCMMRGSPKSSEQSDIRLMTVIRDGDDSLKDRKEAAIGKIVATGGVLYVLFLNHSVSSINELIVRDFCTSDEAVFQEIADLFKKWLYPVWAISRFNRMPDSAKEKIYKELYLLIKERFHLEGGYDQHRAFSIQCFNDCWDINNQLRNRDKAQAIENYLAMQRSV